MTDSPRLEDLLTLRGRTALVTGGCGDIGGAVVRRLLTAGAQVLSVDLPGTEAPEGAEPLFCDLSKEAEVADLAGSLRNREPAVDIFVHCAGVTRDGVLWHLAPADWHEVVKVNLDCAFHLLQAIAPGMRKANRGSVVLMSSINGERGKFGQANYAAAKAGLLGLAKSAARELGPRGIRVNAVAPGLIETRMTADLPQDIKQQAVAETALCRAGQPDEVARVVLFLCSEMSAHVTGQVVRVDGGQCTA